MEGTLTCGDRHTGSGQEEPPFGSPVILLEQHAQRVLEPLPLFDGQRCEKATPRHVLQIDGDSYRMRGHRARLQQIRASLNARG